MEGGFEFWFWFPSRFLRGRRWIDGSNVGKRLTRSAGYPFRSTSSAHADVEDLTYSKKRSPHDSEARRVSDKGESNRVASCMSIEWITNGKVHDQDFGRYGGPLLDRARADVVPSQQQIRIAARKRVYDMRYLTRQRLYSPFLPVTQPLSYSIPPDGKGKEPLRSPSPPSSGSEEETTQIHLDMFTPLSTAIHPHFLLHKHIHPSTDHFSIDSLDEGDRPGLPVPLRSQIEANMKEAWGNLINIAQDIGGVVDEEEDGDYSDEGEGDDDDADEHGVEASPPTSKILPTLDRLASNPPTPQPKNKRTKKTKASRATNGWGVLPGYWGIKERWEALRARQGTRADNSGVVDGWDWAGVEGEWRRVVCWMDYQDLLRRPTGNEEDISEAIRLFAITLRVTGYSPPPLRPTPSSSTPLQDESADPNAIIWYLPVIRFSGESKLGEEGTGTQPPIRKLKGTVKMIGDEAVLWSMTSSYVGQDDPDSWVPGLWTGPDHSRGDPIGPSWQWKVA
ncbi:hypothetical protein F5887DRAFT_1213903 [Amanita rubescens]|nr:hypothetical protein F5887DRAFT_1213903 [Amanita rubescens]